MRVEHEHEFGVPVDQGFAFITDMTNWPRYWPGLLRVEGGSRWREAGDEARVVTRLIGREVELHMTLRRFEPNSFVAYESRQPGLPDARHERHFILTGGGFRYRLVVEYEPRRGMRGLYDRVLVRRGVVRALRQTTANLDGLLGQA
jgi:hypothetical protein